MTGSLENKYLHNIYFEELGLVALKQHIDGTNYSKIFVLVDTNTKEHCLPLFNAQSGLNFDAIIEIKSGEEHKTIQTCQIVWEALSNLGGDRKSLLINLGGGVVTDLGGFAASTFKRGIDFINVPTSLLAMVDAAIGGKTGVDFESLKNQIGVINQPKKIIILPEFLGTLEKRQIKSGFAEMLKHGLISDLDYWNELSVLISLDQAAKHIQKSSEIKSSVVAQDPYETGLRKTLNFGHTLGHAIETYFLMDFNKQSLLHGEAIAIGMILEAYLSHKLTGLSKLELDEIKQTFLHFYDSVSFDVNDIDAIISLLQHDKKNTHGQINFVLLKSIGKSTFDIKAPKEIIEKAFAYYAM